MKLKRVIISLLTAVCLAVLPVLAEGRTTGTQTLGGNTTASFTNELDTGTVTINVACTSELADISQLGDYAAIVTLKTPDGRSLHAADTLNVNGTISFVFTDVPVGNCTAELLPVSRYKADSCSKAFTLSKDSTGSASATVTFTGNITNYSLASDAVLKQH